MDEVEADIGAPLFAQVVVLNEAVQEHVRAEVVGESRRDQMSFERPLQKLDVVIGPAEFHRDLCTELRHGAE